jgi:lauroyl/myristoyl acyltransferase
MIRFLVILLSKLQFILDSIYFHCLEKQHRSQIIHNFITENEFGNPGGDKQLIQKNIDFLKKFKLTNATLVMAGLFNYQELFNEYLSRMDLRALHKLEPYRNSGCVVLSYHIGFYSILMLVLMCHGYDVTLLLRTKDTNKGTKLSTEKIKAGLEALYQKNDKLGCLHFVDAFSLTAILQIQRAIRKGHIILIYPDTGKDASAKSLPIEFFKQKITGHVGLIQIYKILKTSFLPTYLVWEHGKAVLHVHDPLDINEHTADQEILNKIYKLFPELIKQYPEQWIQIISYPFLKY